jgi:hypothetical protein
MFALFPHMRILLVLTTLFLSLVGTAQTGGTNSFAFMDLAFNARSLALGTNFITAKDQDLNIGVANPSLINSKMDKHASFSQALVPGGINYGMANYARAFKGDFVGIGHIRFVDYGKFTRRDEFGNEQGTFKPMDLIIGASAGKSFSPKLSVGATLNLIYSQLESYSSFGAAVDFAGNYYDEEKEFLITLLVKNAGYQFKGYTSNKHDPLPVDLQLGISKKLAHAPFRFSLLLHDLNRWDLSYNDPNAQPTIDALTGDTIPVPKAGFMDKVGRHFTFQTEILVSKNLHLRAAFDLKKRQEMKLATRPGASGISLGLGLYFKKFSVDYGFVVVSRAGFQHMISLSTDLSMWRK